MGATCEVGARSLRDRVVRGPRWRRSPRVLGDVREGGREKIGQLIPRCGVDRRTFEVQIRMDDNIFIFWEGRGRSRKTPPLRVGMKAKPSHIFSQKL